MRCTFLLMLTGWFWSGSTPEIAAIYDERKAVISISGISAREWPQLQVSVIFGEAVDEGLPGVMGKVDYKDGEVTFKPKYGFSTGSIYTVIIQSAKSPEVHKLRVKVPARDKVSATFVTNVFPSAASLPMNQLKLYIQFSAAMRMGKAYEHIKLYRLPEGILEEEAFLAMPEELWDPERKRLTIFFDPGRIKRGVQPNLQLGLPLVEGRRYKLVIDPKWLDLNGAVLTRGFEKEFRVEGVDRESPNPEEWEVLAPAGHSQKALVLDFGEHLDYGLLHSALVVVDAFDKPIKGIVTLSHHESRWHFTPDRPWLPGDYKLVINPWLEDLAGNNLRRKFDIDLQNPADTPKDIKEVTLPFQITQNN